MKTLKLKHKCGHEVYVKLTPRLRRRGAARRFKKEALRDDCITCCGHKCREANVLKGLPPIKGDSEQQILFAERIRFDKIPALEALAEYIHRTGKFSEYLRMVGNIPTVNAAWWWIANRAAIYDVYWLMVAVAARKEAKQRGQHNG
jgi:hypothetical protein